VESGKRKAPEPEPSPWVKNGLNRGLIMITPNASPPVTAKIQMRGYQLKILRPGFDFLG
jgi:hypothetical protein